MPVSLTTLYPYAFPQQRVVVSVSLQAHQQNVLLDFLIFANLVGEKWYLSAVLICISLIMGKVEHLFICLSTIFISFGGGELSLFLIFYLIFGLFILKSYQMILGIVVSVHRSLYVYTLQNFLPTCQLSSAFVMMFFWPSEIVFLFMTRALLMSDATFSIC